MNDNDPLKCLNRIADSFIGSLLAFAVLIAMLAMPFIAIAALVDGDWGVGIVCALISVFAAVTVLKPTAT